MTSTSTDAGTPGEQGWPAEPRLRLERLVHDLRTPLTIVTGFSDLLERRDDLTDAQRTEFVGRIAGAGAQVVYLTGRREEMRPGTEHVLGAFGFPIPGGRVALWMKPDPELHDDVFKREAHRRLGTLGRVIAAFDNEPHHVNDYRASFPAAAVIHLGTDHSGRLDMLSEGVVTVPHFEFREPDETL